MGSSVENPSPDQSSSDQSSSVESGGREQKFFHEVHVIRGGILVVALAIAAAILYYASPILIPVVLALFLAYVLNPFVEGLMRLRIPNTQIRVPRSLAAMVVVVLAVGLTVALGTLIGDQLGSFATDLSRQEDRITGNIRSVKRELIDVQRRIKRYMEPLRSAKKPPASPALPTPDGVDSAPAKATDSSTSALLDQTDELLQKAPSYIAGSLSGLLAFVAQALTCIFVTLFMLMEAESVRQKLINIMGTTPKRREMVLEVIYNVNRDVQRYLFNRFATNVVLAAAAMLCFWMYGLDYVLLLGILAGLFNFVPYVGPLVGSIFPGMVAYIQFGTIESVVWVLLIYGLLTGVEGNVVTPVVLGRHLKLNSLAVMLGLVFWGWIWGAIGMLLAIPIMAAIKAVALHVDDMRPVAELLRAD